MTRLDELSAEQEAALPSWLQELLAIAISTDPADREAAEDGVRLAYESVSLRPPRTMMWLESPYAGCLEAGSRHTARSDSSSDGPSGPIRLLNPDPGYVRARVRRLVRNQVRDRLRADVGDRARATVRALVGDPLLDRLGTRLGDLVGQQLLDQVPPEMRDRVEQAIPGQHDHWVLYASVWAKLGVDVSPLDGLMAVARNAGWWWPSEDFVILTDRPKRIRRDDLGRLHCEDGPALLYRDGWTVYAWRGIRVPASLIESHWTFDRIMQESDHRIRRCAIDKMGWDRFVAEASLEQVGPTVPDPGNPGYFLSLYELPYVVDDLKLRLLICDNGTPEADGHRHRFGLTVPATLDDPLSAVAWTFDVTPAEYARLERGA
jgi:Domain of unknown function (DUF6745)